MKRILTTLIALATLFPSLHAEKARIHFNESKRKTIYQETVGSPIADPIEADVLIDGNRFTLPNFLNSGISVSISIDGTPYTLQDWVKSHGTRNFQTQYGNFDNLTDGTSSNSITLTDASGTLATPNLFNVLDYGKYCDQVTLSSIDLYNPFVFYTAHEESVTPYQICIYFSGHLESSKNEFIYSDHRIYGYLNILMGIGMDEIPNSEVLIHAVDGESNDVVSYHFNELHFENGKYILKDFFGSDFDLYFTPQFKPFIEYPSNLIYDNKSTLSGNDDSFLYLGNDDFKTTEGENYSLSIPMTHVNNGKKLTFNQPKINIRELTDNVSYYYNSGSYEGLNLKSHDFCAEWDIVMDLEGTLIDDEGKSENKKLKFYFQMPNLSKYRIKEQMEYDGHYLCVTPKDNTSIITYNLKDGTTGLIPCGGMIDPKGCNEVMITISSDKETNAFSFNPPYYSELLLDNQTGCHDRHIYVSEAGSLNDALHDNWGPNIDYYSPSSTNTLHLHGNLNVEDYNTLRTFVESCNYKNYYTHEYLGIRAVDLSDIDANTMPANALADMTNLVSIIMPNNFDGSTKVFGNNKHLGSIEFTNPEITLKAEALDGIDNKNVFVFAPSYETVKNIADKFQNIIVDRNADKITLDDKGYYFTLKTFTAKDIIFTKEFTKETGINGGCAGWEALMLPFEVESFSHNGETILPFASECNTDVKRFWLYSREDSKWKADSLIHRDIPYLIAMPNNDHYIGDVNLAGTVEFHGYPNTKLYSTQSIQEWPDVDFGSIYEYIRSSYYSDWSTYFVNKDESEGIPAGGAFLREEREAGPFEWYIYSRYGLNRHAMPIFAESEVAELLAETAVKVWSEGHDLCVLSGRDMQVRVHDLSGCLVRTLRTEAGVTSCVSDLKPGIYFAAGKKVLVK